MRSLDVRKWAGRVVRYTVFFVIEVKSRAVEIAGI
jgi:hypothetical protein